MQSHYKISSKHQAFFKYKKRPAIAREEGTQTMAMIQQHPTTQHATTVGQYSCHNDAGQQGITFDRFAGTVHVHSPSVTTRETLGGQRHKIVFLSSARIILPSVSELSCLTARSFQTTEPIYQSTWRRYPTTFVFRFNVGYPVVFQASNQHNDGLDTTKCVCLMGQRG